MPDPSDQSIPTTRPTNKLERLIIIIDKYKKKINDISVLEVDTNQIDIKIEIEDINHPTSKQTGKIDNYNR